MAYAHNRCVMLAKEERKKGRREERKKGRKEENNSCVHVRLEQRRCLSAYVVLALSSLSNLLRSLVLPISHLEHHHVVAVHLAHLVCVAVELLRSGLDLLSVEQLHRAG